MGVNQVKFGNATVMDISDSTVAPETLLSGVTAYNKAGNKITGEVVVEHVEVDPVLETGTKSATITVGEESADIYCENTKIEVKNMKTTQSATITNGIAQFECIDKNFVKALKLTMEPIQDLHGYDHPWAGGAGTNKFGGVALRDKIVELGGDADTQSLGTGWCSIGAALIEGQVLYSDFKENTQYTLIIRCKKQNGNTNSNIRFDYTDGTYSWIFLNTPVTDEQTVVAVSTANKTIAGIVGKNSSVGIMLKYNECGVFEGVKTADDFAPYENICPISGRTEASVFESGINLWDLSACIRAYIAANGTTVSENKNYLCDKFYFVKRGESITLSSKNACTRMCISVFNTSFNFVERNQVSSVKQTSYTAKEDCYIKAHFNYDNSERTIDEWNVLCDTIELQLQLGDILLPYEPFKKYTAITHQYKQEIIGGVDDFVNGGLDNEYELFEPTTVTTVAQSSGIWYWAFSLPKSSTNTLSTNGLRCSHFKPANQVFAIGNCYITANGTLFVCVPSDQTLNTGALANAWLAENDLQFAYKPTTPATISTSAEKITTLPGVNVISATEPISECSYRVLEENLSDTIYSNETLVGEDSDVYTFRTTPDISDANYVEENVVGGSVIWNQIIQYAKATYVTENGLTVTNNGDNTVSISGTTNATGMAVLTERVTVPRKDHVVLYMLNKVIGYNWGISGYGATAGSADKRFLFFKRNDTTDWLGAIQCSIGINVTVDVKNVRCSMIDLTRMFGNTGVADYIYTLEQATSGAGIEFLQSYGFFTKDYYDYNAGSLQSVNFNKWFKTSKNLFNTNRMQGVNNIIDGNDVYVRLNKDAVQYFHDYKSYIPGNRTYTLQFDPPSDITWTYASLRCRLKDNSDYGNVGAIDGWTYQNASKSYYQTFENASHVEVTATTPDCLYCEFGIGTNNWFENIKETGTYVKFSNIQLEVGSEATDYEPYEGYEISLDDDLDLRGLFRITDNKLVADGDIYEGDGKITRKYSIVDLGDLTWYYNSTNDYFYATVSGIKHAESSDIPSNIISSQYITVAGNFIATTDRAVASSRWDDNVYIKDTRYDNATDFKTAMSGVILQYELAEPILNRGINFDSPQVFIPNGNEYFVKTYTSTPDRDFDVPAGHVGKYYGKSMFKEISLPTIPKSGGTYTLKCNVLADGNKKLYWCADNN